MQPTIKAGLVLGVAVEVWTFFVLAMRWHTDPVTLALFYLVIPLQAGVLVWGLRMTAAQGKTYGGQVMSGVVMSAVASVIIFVGSYILTTVVFPDYFAELTEGMRSMLLSQGLSDADIQIRIDEMASSNTPLMNALNGAIATIVTGLIISLIVGAFVKAKPDQTPEAAGPSAGTQ